MVGNHRMIAAMACKQSTRSRKMQRISNHVHATHRKKIGGRFCPNPEIWEMSGGRVDLRSENSDALKLCPPQLPNQKSDSDGWHGVGKAWGRAMQRTPHCGGITPGAYSVGHFKFF